MTVAGVRSGRQHLTAAMKDGDASAIDRRNQRRRSTMAMDNGSSKQGYLIGQQCLTAFNGGGEETSANMLFNSSGGGW